MIKATDPKRCACGAAGKRDCPALNTPICPTCCASKRGPTFGCPADCPNYPFGNRAYDVWRRIDSNAVGKILKRVLASQPDKEAIRNRMESLAKELAGDEPDENTIASASMMVIHQAMFLDRDSNGQTLADKWEKANWDGLSNDERTMVALRRSSHPSIIEFQKPVDNHAYMCVDLLDPDRKPFSVHGFTLNSTPRYTRSLTWICHYPHFSHVGPVGVVVPPELTEDLVSSIRARAKKKAGLFSRADPKAWLLENFIEACKLVEQLMQERRAKMLASMDIAHCLAKYRLKIPLAAAAATLKARQDFVVEDRHPPAGDGGNAARFVWLRRGESADAKPPEASSGLAMDAQYAGVPTVGNVTLNADGLNVETFAKWKFDFAKGRLASIFGKDIELVEEKTTDMRELMARRATGEASAADDRDDAGERAYEEALDAAPGRQMAPPPVPESERRRILGQQLDAHYRKTLDEPVPMLKNKTPRQAAKDPSSRPLLLEWGKGLLNTLDRQRRDGNDPGTDLRWLFEELDMKELL